MYYGGTILGFRLELNEKYCSMVSTECPFNYPCGFREEKVNQLDQSEKKGLPLVAMFLSHQNDMKMFCREPSMSWFLQILVSIASPIRLRKNVKSFQQTTDGKYMMKLEEEMDYRKH